ncbi:SiaC family regulatory phosphoprotein [Ekhidna sp.]|uniref:SiaC family regulatory phosphoprotein n=1 Tax=Ekhidna sp. TaxID=2608089 RepID=UPI003B50A3E5
MDYFLKATRTTPAIIMDSNSKSALIKGVALSNDWSFHQQLILDISKQLQNSNYNDLNIQLKVFNIKAAKFLIEVLKTIKDCESPINIHWLYDKEDLEMLEMGKDYGKLLGMKFELNPN